MGKLVYCTRTVPEMEKVLAELKTLVKYRMKELDAVANNEMSTNGKNGEILALGLR